jgi:penicillin V acylase-like amidase (Ntn superfamily)
MKKIIACFLLVIFANTALPCTTFCINKNGQIIFGRNYDWITGAGTVNTNLRGLFQNFHGNRRWKNHKLDLEIRKYHL